jgi:predicted nuclease with TOPRIM domain
MVLDYRLSKLLQQIADQQALIRRMVTQGSSNQAAEDRLRQLQRELARLREAGAPRKA